jgi:hypothetical protein
MYEISALFAEGSVFRTLPGQRAIVSEVLRGCTQCYNFEIFLYLLVDLYTLFTPVVRLHFWRCGN